MELEAALARWQQSADPATASDLLATAQGLGTELPSAPTPALEATRWREFLDVTSRPAFLTQLSGPAEREAWCEVALRAIGAVDLTLEDLLDRRVAEHPDRALFIERGRSDPRAWTYLQVRRRVRSVAATIRSRFGADARVAILADNGLGGACADLACLLHDIVVSPLSVHFDADELEWILRRLDVKLVLADTDDRIRKLVEIRRRSGASFEIWALQSGRSVERGQIPLLDAEAAALEPAEVDSILRERVRLDLDAPCTVMFTSGSTGRPKGVVFSRRNLVTKRFARAAALPAVGESEVLLCYLPLFHTFGRFLEMLGMLFWRGTYVFVGNPSADALLVGLREIEPTGLISIPLRWTQLRDRIVDGMDAAGSSEEREAQFRQVVGSRLRWGLSAAGYLDPKAFRFFQGRGVELCSGFGMTEATGGITMSPPGEYVEDTVGRPLPGIRVELTEQGEMRIAGPYVARYLVAEAEGLLCEPRIVHENEEWIATGDLFRELELGHLTIVDRLKDIYKNDRGQTIAPRRVERAVENVAGIKRAFLVGDHRSWNVLLIVPDRDDPIYASLGAESDEREYFQRIVAAANGNLAPFERVVDFAVLDRDLDAERGELTPKQTYRRKTIETNFADVIANLYRNPLVEREVDGVGVRVPRWVLRDLGILEEDLGVDADGLVDRRRGRRLPLGRAGARIRVGELDYEIADGVVDLGLFARQPRLWLGNPSLVAFLPCREGWDGPHAGIGTQAMVDPAAIREGPPEEIQNAGLRAGLRELHQDLATSLLCRAETSLNALEELGSILPDLEEPMAGVIRARLVALSRHPDEAVRCLAYQILLLDERAAEEDPGFSAFLDSGQAFLDEKSIRAIAASSLGPRRLEALRRRLVQYRRRLAWPTDGVVRDQLQHVMRLLSDFVRHHPYYYKPVRAELASWLLLREDPELARSAREQLESLTEWFEASLESRHRSLTKQEWERRAFFDADIAPEVRRRIEHLFGRTAFLEQAIYLIFEDEAFALDQIAPGGLWISRVRARGTFQLLRASVNTDAGRHYELLVILREDMDAEAVLETNFWMLAIGGYPIGARVLPRFGCVRPELAAMALEFVRDLNVEERIRAMGAAARVDASSAATRDWYRLFVRAMTAFFVAWDHGGRRIVPGLLSPANVVVSEQDFREGPLILSLTGWEPYRNPLSLVAPLFESFFRKTRAQVPVSRAVLRVEWIFDACREALGPASARDFLRDLQDALESGDAAAPEAEIAAALPAYREKMKGQAWTPIAVRSAVDRYHAWTRVNPLATISARIEQVESLVRLYRLDQLGEIARFELYRDTFFAESGGAVRDALDRVIDVLHQDPSVSVLRRVELSELQATIQTPEERVAFRRLAFPRTLAARTPEVITFGDAEHPRVTVRTRVKDAHEEAYEVREPVTPEEIGQVYRLFFRRRFPKTVSEYDRYLITLDETGRLVAAICYQVPRPEVAHMDGIVVVPSLEGRGLASALLEDFCARQANVGVSVVQTTYFMRAFCEKRGFGLDRRWSGLVRFLADD